MFLCATFDMRCHPLNIAHQLRNIFKDVVINFLQEVADFLPAVCFENVSIMHMARAKGPVPDDFTVDFKVSRYLIDEICLHLQWILNDVPDAFPLELSLHNQHFLYRLKIAGPKFI